MISIRLATADDYPKIQQIALETIQENYRSLLSADEYKTRLSEVRNWNPAQDLECDENFLLVALIDTEIAGFLIGRNNSKFKVTYIDQIRISPNFQRRGLGTLLLNELSGPCLILTVSQKNQNAIDFYHKNGFVINNKYRDRFLMHKGECNRTHQSIESFLHD